MTTHDHPLPPPPPAAPLPPAAEPFVEAAPFDAAAAAPLPPSEIAYAPEAAPFPEAAPDPAALAENLSPFRRFWRKYGGDSFLISVGIHAILLVIAVTWVVSVVIINEKKPDSFDTGPGGGENGKNALMTEHRVKPKNAKNIARSSMKIMSKTSASSVTLPETPNLSMASLENSISGGDPSKGEGGGGGGGPGGGIGVGNGKGRNMNSLFGITPKGGSGLLVGTLYDLKKSRNGTALFPAGDRGGRINEMKKSYIGFVRAGCNKSYFETRYPSAQKNLEAFAIFIPPLDANLATKFFDCEKEIQAPGWLVLYEGWITPPESGQYRFAGMGDDGMLVAINRSVKFWGPWTQGGMQTWVKTTKDWEPKIAYTPGGSLPGLGNGGRYFGDWFSMNKGTTYFIQIVIAEGFGGIFSAELMIQQRSKNSEKHPDISTPLPVFTLLPFTDEDVKMRQKSRMRWTEKAPVFGLEANGVKARPVPGSRTR